jgi:hypothetical protein
VPLLVIVALPFSHCTLGFLPRIFPFFHSSLPVEPSPYSSSFLYPSTTVDFYITTCSSSLDAGIYSQFCCNHQHPARNSPCRAVSREQSCMALGEMLAKLPVDEVGQFARVSVSALEAVIRVDREWRVVDAACGALASVIVKFPNTVALHNEAVPVDESEDGLPSASGLALKMFEILPLNVGHAASVLVALMRISSAGVESAVEDYISGNVRAYTKQNFSMALSGTC